MNRTAMTTVAALALAAALTACSSSDSTDAKPTPAKSSAAASKAPSDALAAAGIPAKPTGQARTDLLAALRKVNPALVTDEDDAIDNARNQCSAINGKSPKVDDVAQARFNDGTHTVSAAEAKQINAALATFCKTA
ncbi:DUF732 domain-containing protein [Streptomyces sp. NBC_00124]|uniref:DUF732 domain-containing protein n=1 Tax=Streptomyces sp. NBC_00124 TaxID=2975662 RepID=UPI00225C144C|nr:DUF732 domain-containing protein [Streptomyces sp. NBC_00124]MCX5362892.1 DUF732 domain-containing protein [Streptomyces sp. NBC_00124]